MKLLIDSINFIPATASRIGGEQSHTLNSVDVRGTMHLGNGLSVDVTDSLTPDEYEALRVIVASIEKRVIEKIKASI